MTEYEFDLSKIDTLTVEAESQSGAIEALLGTIEQRAKATSIPMIALKVYKVRNEGIGCYYNVEGYSEADAEQTLVDYMQERRDEARENVDFGTPEHDLLTDLNITCETIREVEVDPEIDKDGNLIH